MYTSLAFDLLGRPAIAYYDITNTSLKYVQDTDGDFSLVDETPVTVVNQFSEGWYASLVFDPLNRPMIAHFDNTNDDLRFSVQEPGIGWVTTTVDSTGSTGWYPSIAIDPDTGFPAIAYYDSTNTDLRYAAWDGDAWNPTTVDATGIVGAYPSLAFDPADGNPAIAYYDTHERRSQAGLARRQHLANPAGRRGRRRRLYALAGVQRLRQRISLDRVLQQRRRRHRPTVLHRRPAGGRRARAGERATLAAGSGALLWCRFPLT